MEGCPETTANCFAPLDYYELRSTGQGALFLETFRNQDFYTSIKQKAAEIGCGLMPNILMTLAQKYIANGG